VILPTGNLLNETIIFKHFIDDIIWLSYGENNTTHIKNALIEQFDVHGFSLLFNCVSTADTNCTSEFLDVQHVIKELNGP